MSDSRARRPVLAAAMAASCCIMLFSLPLDAGRASSCLVRVVRLANVPVAVYSSVEMSVEVRIGTRSLFTTPRKPVVRPVFGNRITASTVASRPLVFMVRMFEPKWVPEDVEDGGMTSANQEVGGIAPVRMKRPELDEDEVLSMGFDNLIGDYGTSPAKTRKVMEVADPAPVPTPVPASARSQKNRVRPVLKPLPIPTYADEDLVPHVLCKISVPWPPADGPHTLICGGVELHIETEMVGGH